MFEFVKSQRYIDWEIKSAERDLKSIFHKIYVSHDANLFISEVNGIKELNKELLNFNMSKWTRVTTNLPIEEQLNNLLSLTNDNSEKEQIKKLLFINKNEYFENLDNVYKNEPNRPKMIFLGKNSFEDEFKNYNKLKDKIIILNFESYDGLWQSNEFKSRNASFRNYFEKKEKFEDSLDLQATGVVLYGKKPLLIVDSHNTLYDNDGPVDEIVKVLKYAHENGFKLLQCSSAPMGERHRLEDDYMELCVRKSVMAKEYIIYHLDKKQFTAPAIIYVDDQPDGRVSWLIRENGGEVLIAKGDGSATELKEMIDKVLAKLAKNPNPIVTGYAEPNSVKLNDGKNIA